MSMTRCDNRHAVRLSKSEGAVKKGRWICDSKDGESLSIANAILS